MINILQLVLLLLVSSTLFAADSDQQCVPEGKWVTHKGSLYSNNEVMKLMAENKVVLLGEDHDNPEHHRWQLQTMAGLYGLVPNLALGFESFPRATQKYLDQWVAGELEEKEFLEKVNWEKIWSFNKDYYMPMFHFARMNKIPMYALNVERELVSAAAEKGWENVPVQDREGVGNPAPATQDYIEVLAEVFSQHMPSHAHEAKEGDAKTEPMVDLKVITENPGFKRFVTGQLVWDRAMAEVLQRAIEQDKHTLIIGVLGAGHIVGNYGVPHQLKDLGVNKIKTAMPWDGNAECEQLREGAVDVAYGVKTIDTSALGKSEDRPRLGVYLENREKGVYISKLVDGSIASQIGMQVDDQIVELAGKPVEKVTDVVKGVQATAFGTWLPIKVKRQDKNIELIAKFPPR